MKFPTSLRPGIIVTLTAIALYAVPVTWIKTRNFVPLDTPVTFSNGHFLSPEFKVSLDAPYFIGFYDPADQNPPYTFCDDRTWQNAKWNVFKDGHPVAVNHEPRSGLPSACEFTGQANDSFNAGPGTYSVDVEIDRVPECLEFAKLRLQAITSQDKYWKHYFALCGICLVLGGTGISLLIQGVWFSIQSRTEIPRNPRALISQSPGYTRNFGLRKSRSMRLIHHLPDFGLMHIVTVLSLFILCLFAWMSEAYSMGIAVLIVTPDHIRAANHSRTEPLRVWLNIWGEFLVNEKPVPRDELQDAVRYELAHRANELVYFGADGNPAFAEAAFAMNEIQIAGGKLVWLTPKTRSDFESQNNNSR